MLDELDDDTQPTMILAPRRILLTTCPLCYLEVVAHMGPWDARQEPLGICKRHLELLSCMDDTSYEVAMGVQYQALLRWLYPYSWGEIS